MLLPLLLFVFPLLGKAQFPPKPEGLTFVTSNLNKNVTISYKQTHICETTPGVKSFSGYVHLPQSTLSDLNVGFDIHTFFWFFEARNDPKNAPLVVYLAGGPGESSVFTALNSETGPCYVNLDGNSTALNPWSFNNDANILYIDQPVSAGFSYTSLINATIDVRTEKITPLSTYDSSVKPNATVGIGTFSDQSSWATTNTTTTSALALWHFAEHWLTQFPEYASTNKKIGIWGNSAGGYWAPANAALWHKKIQQSATVSPLKEWSIDNMGITDGAIDLLQAMPFYPEFAFNNTYQAPLISREIYLSAKNNLTKEGGCNDLVMRCRVLGEEGDPQFRGTNETVNTACQQATAFCMVYVGAGLSLVGRNPFDIAQKTDNDEFCAFYYPAVAFLNHEWTQKALGAVTNFTSTSNMVIDSYTLTLPEKLNVGTGDTFRVTSRDLEYAVESGIRVSLIYGDRDGRCPWTAAEDLANKVNYTNHAKFLSAGYEEIVTNNTYKGGVVKQYENLSFSRVFQAGHAVNAYQPETVSRMFSRAIAGKDIATGKKQVQAGYSTVGPQSSWNMVQQKLQDAPPTCMVLGSFQDTSPWKLLTGRTETGGNGSNNGNGTGLNGGPSFSSASRSHIPGSIYVTVLFLAMGVTSLV